MISRSRSRARVGFSPGRWKGAMNTPNFILVDAVISPTSLHIMPCAVATATLARATYTHVYALCEYRCSLYRHHSLSMPCVTERHHTPDSSQRETVDVYVLAVCRGSTPCAVRPIVECQATLVQLGRSKYSVLSTGSHGKTRRFPVTASAEGFRAACSASARHQLNGAPSPAPNWRGNCGAQH